MLFCMFDDYFLDICDGDRERERERQKNYIYIYRHVCCQYWQVHSKGSIILIESHIMA